MADISREQFRQLTSIILKNAWLQKRYIELEDLMFRDCISKCEQELIGDLLSRFHYVSSETLSNHIHNLALAIVTTPFASQETTIIAAMAADSSPDSSQSLVQFIKVKLQDLNWGDVHIVNTFASAFRASKQSGFKKINIILIDEFIGSGQTVIGRIAEIKKQFATAGINPKIAVHSIFSSIIGENRLKNENIEFSILEIIKRGISDFYLEPELTHKLETMLTMESRLEKKYKTHDFLNYSMGYGKAESLISIENSNIPNNVFPVFWWPTYSDGTKRSPLFTRWLGR